MHATINMHFHVPMLATWVAISGSSLGVTWLVALRQAEGPSVLGFFMWVRLRFAPSLFILGSKLEEWQLAGQLFSWQRQKWKKKKKSRPTMQAGFKPLLVSHLLASQQWKQLSGPSPKSRSGKSVPLLTAASEKPHGEGRTQNKHTTEANILIYCDLPSWS